MVMLCMYVIRKISWMIDFSVIWDYCHFHSDRSPVTSDGNS